MLYLQKFVASFIELPGLFITIFLILSVVFLLKKRKKLFSLFLIFALIFYFLSTDLSLQLLVRPYEAQYSQHELPAVSAEENVIVVFSGGMIRGIESGGMVYDQMGPHSMMRLYRAFQAYEKTGAPIILSGGNVYHQPGKSLSSVMATVLASWGVPSEIIITEQQSKTTWENALFSLELIDPTIKNIILVTSALHMPRSYQTFQRVMAEKGRSNINLIAYPGDYRVEKAPLTLAAFLPNSGALDIFSAAFHEWLGNLFYRLK